MERVKSLGTWLYTRIENVIKIVALLAVLFGATTDQFKSGVQYVVGTDAIITTIDKVQVAVDSNREAIKTLRGDYDIAVYDDNQSYVHEGCHIGSICTATIAVKRTPFGDACGIPDLAPKVRNHGGRKLAAEGATEGVKVSADEWNLIEVQFVAPARAYPGRGTFWVDLAYPCPSGTVHESSNKLPFALLGSLLSPRE